MSWLGQVRHLLAKDVRRFWPMLLAWGALLGVWVWGLAPGQILREGAEPTGMISTVAPFIIAFFVGMVTLEDHPVSDRAFWFTRSVSPLALLTAKLLLLGLCLVLLPALMHAGVAMAWDAAGASSTLALNDLIRHGAFVLLMAWAASTASSLSSFAGFAFAGYLAFRYLPMPLSAGPRAQPQVVEYLTWLGWGAIGLGALVLHVGTRKRGASLAVGLVGLWGLEAGLSHMPEVDRQLVRVPEVIRTVEADSVSVSIHTLSHQPDLDSSRVSARLDVRTPPGLLPRLRDARSSLMGSGSLYFSKARERGSHRGGDLIASAHLDYRPIPPTRWFDGAGGTFDVLHGPADSVTAELARAEGLVVRVAIDLYRPVTRASLPLREGALAEVEGGRVQIRGVDLSAHRPKVTVSLISWRRELVGDAPPSIGSSLDFGFVHHTRGETLRPLAMHGSGGAIEGMLGGAFVEVEERTFEYGVGPWDSVPGPGWFRSAELEVLELEYVGTVERTVGQVISEWPLLGSRVVLAPEDGR